MANDNAMNLRNRVIPRNFGSDQQPSNSDNAKERQAVLPAESETSGQSDQQEPSLAQALGQMTRVLQILDQNSHRSTARLDAVLAAIMASNENIARIGQLLTRNEQPATGLQGPVMTPVRGHHFKRLIDRVVVNAGQQPEIAWGLPPPPPIAAYQPQNVEARAGGQAPNIQGANPVVQNFGLPQGPNIAQAQVPILGNNNEIYAQIEEAIQNIFGEGARPAMRPVFRSPYPANIDAEHPYPANWKMPKFDKFFGDKTENTVEHVARFTAQCLEAAADPFLKLRLFNTSLTKTAFTWYTSLPANSVRD
uniref:Retrotransposon gag domain-containing protein n=1 Tax=Ananas comosus var. bracteatus TaxID=296719 RepID=A0A6V7PH98_ANACO|nr:unnamed protein product [Ananas comosus var. bracteatus]